jgi:hypothetical protein
MHSVDLNTIVVSVDEIIPGLYLGNEAASQSARWFAAVRPALIVNASRNISSPWLGKARYIRVPVDDPGAGCSMDNKHILAMRLCLPFVIRTIYHHLAIGYPVFVHCHAGAQRSAIIVLVYLMSIGYSYDAAMQKIILRRPVAFYGGTHVNFAPVLD